MKNGISYTHYGADNSNITFKTLHLTEHESEKHCNEFQKLGYNL